MAYAPPAPMDDDDDRALEKVNSDLDSNVDRAARGQAAVALRISGATYSQIARTLGYVSVTQARQAVERTLASTVGTEGRDQMRFIESRRLERLLQSLWGKATAEDDPDHLAYVRTAIAVIDRHARLNGLDAPQEMVIYNPAGAEIEAWVANMARQVHGELPDEYDIIEGKVEDDPVGDDD